MMIEYEKSKQLRKNITSYIQKKPGCNYSKIMKHFGLGSSSIAHHMARLEDGNEIFAVSDGHWKRFYPISMKNNHLPNPLTRQEKKIYKSIENRPGSTYKDFMKEFGKTRQSFIYHIKKLTKMNLIRVERVKCKSYFYVNVKAE